ncbi:annexin-B12-like [Planococcus citri]|uniref:annexin-B12-like n=1 Tax=Planococcus citri TaxID=170843 RepID=UPI0031F8C0F6
MTYHPSCSDCFYYDITQGEQTPTVGAEAEAVFDASCDAQILQHALKDDLDKDAIINVLTKRTNHQRLKIAAEFKKLCGKDLISELKKKLSGDFKKLMVALVKRPADFLAKELHHAVGGIGTDEKTLVEIICTATNFQLDCIKAAYEKKYGKTLAEDVADDTSGSFRRLLVSLLCACRPECECVNEEDVCQDVSDLIAAGLGSKSDEKSIFNKILCTRSYDHLRRVFQQYRHVAQCSLEEAIEEEFSGDLKIGMLAIVYSVGHKSAFFAERLHDAISRIGTNDRKLIRIVVSRCEVDMFDIKQEYKKCYHKSLEEDVAEDTSGHYRKALLSLIGDC